jgi:uncharacterized protein
MHRKWLVSLVLVLLLSASCKAPTGTEPNDLPKPTDYVSDFAHVLSPSAIEEIDRVCGQLDHSNADTQVAVVTIPSLGGADIAEYATNLSNTWRVGSRKSNRGVLVLLAIKDHKWRIAVSRALEGTLTDSKALSIGEKMIPLLRANDFDGALRLAVDQIAQAVSPK